MVLLCFDDVLDPGKLSEELRRRCNFCGMAHKGSGGAITKKKEFSEPPPQSYLY